MRSHVRSAGEAVYMAYPMAFRQLLVAAYQQGEGSLADLAETYGVSIPTVHAWVQRARQPGDLAARTSPGRPPTLDSAARNYLRSLVAEDHDATLPMRAHALTAHLDTPVSPRR